MHTCITLKSLPEISTADIIGSQLSSISDLFFTKKEQHPCVMNDLLFFFEEHTLER